MKKKLHLRILVMFLVLSIAGGLSFSQPTTIQAASKSARVVKIKKTYRNYLKKNAKTYKYFRVLDINKDGYPELICKSYSVMHRDWRIYTYYKGKIQRVHLPDEKQNGYTIYMRYNSSSKSIFLDCSGSAWMGGSYILKGKKLIKQHSFNWWHNSRLLDNKQCSEKTMKKWYNHYRTILTLHQNTSANRKRYC